MPRAKELLTAVRAMLVLTLVLGLAYPLVVTGIAQVAMPGRADGSLIEQDGKVVGSKLLGVAQHPYAEYFLPRPSATGYSTDASYFSNRGPNSDPARQFYRAQVALYLKRFAATSPGLNAGNVPIDAVTTSGSGVDPDISKANAAIQARRVAAARGVPLATITKLVKAHTHGRLLGVFGEPGVNVPELNLALSTLKATS